MFWQIQNKSILFWVLRQSNNAFKITVLWNSLLFHDTNQPLLDHLLNLDMCSLFINTNCSHEAGLQVQRNTLINNTMCITKRYKIFKPISINNNLVLKLVP